MTPTDRRPRRIERTASGSLIDLAALDALKADWARRGLEERARERATWVTRPEREAER